MERATVTAFLERLNAAWLQPDYPALAICYHPDVVLLPPDAGEPIVGRDAVLDSYREFHAAGTVESFQPDPAALYPFPGGATCHMGFGIEYRLGNAHFSERGLEVYTLVPDERGDDCQIVWRAQFAL